MSLLLSAMHFLFMSIEWLKYRNMDYIWGQFITKQREAPVRPLPVVLLPTLQLVFELPQVHQTEEQHSEQQNGIYVSLEKKDMACHFLFYQKTYISEGILVLKTSVLFITMFLAGINSSRVIQGTPYYIQAI